VTQHAGLTPERWSAFTLEQQILMIGNEMQRAAHWFGLADRTALRGCYERVLRLVDLTVEVNSRSTLRRELLRWRDLIATLYIATDPDAAAHDAAYRCLLLTTPGSAKQIPYMALAGGPGPGANGPRS
jgi:hypothetical protein